MLRLFYLLLATLVAADARVDLWYWPCSEIIISNQAVAKLATSPLFDFQIKAMCQNRDALISLYQCFDGLGELMQDKIGIDKGIKLSWDYINYECKEVNTTVLYTYDEIKPIWENNKPTQDFYTANQTGSGTFTTPRNMTDGLMWATFGKYTNIWTSFAYSEATVYYVMGCMCLGVIFNFMSWITPKLAGAAANSWPSRQVRRYVTMPATFGPRVSYWFSFYGQRLPVIMLIGYFILCLVLYFPTYEIYTYKWLPHRYQIWGWFIGVRSGYFCMYKLPYLFLFGGRNNILIWLTGWDMSVFNIWHRWIGRLATIDAIVHFVAWSIYYQTTIGKTWKLLYWVEGVIAMIAMIIMCVQGWVYIRRFAYDFFVLLHIALAIVTIVTLYYHVLYVDETLELCYAVFAIWGFDHAARLARLVMHGVSNATVVETADDFLTFTVPHNGPIKAYAGSHVYIHICHPLYFWQSHPLSSHETPEGIKLVCRVRNGLTKKIRDMVRSKGGERNFKILVDGPYGVPVNTGSYDEVAYYAGGIGITAIYSHITKRFNSATKQLASLHWVIPDRRPLLVFEKELKTLAANNVAVHVHIDPLPGATVDALPPMTEELSSISEMSDDLKLAIDTAENSVTENIGVQEHNGRPDLSTLISEQIRESQGSLLVMCCGPSPMNLMARSTVANNLNLTRNYIQYFDEGFGM